MNQKKILAVGVQLPGIESIPFDSDRSLLDADIIFYYPCLDRRTSGDGSYFASHGYSPSDTRRVQSRIQHWSEELCAALEFGKLVVVMLAKPLSSTGETVDQLMRSSEQFISSYLPLPKYPCPEVKQGTQMRLTDQAGFLKEYWKCFAKHSNYEVIIEGDFSRDLITTKTGNRLVGAELRYNGTMLLLPNLTCKGIPFGCWRTSEPKWTQEARQFSQKLSSCLVGIYDELLTTKSNTPPPAWALAGEFRITEEERIKGQIEEVQIEIERCQNRLAELRTNQTEASSLRALLYEQGKPLEAAVRQALTILGFDANGLADGESEFDVVFSSIEGRCLGEVEGRNNASIAIEKLSQLERNIHEDLDREEIATPAKGVLFGNAYRLLALTERTDFFTAKCVSAAKRTRVALVRTPDLFEPACYLIEHPDSNYARACREAILEAEGDVVIFPAPPLSSHSSIGPIPDDVAAERGRQLQDKKSTPTSKS